MARGRFISKKIITDREVNALSDDTCRLGWTWLITIADAEGRTVGEPDLLKAALFPRRSDITADRMEKYIMEWADASFVLWYYGPDNDRYIQIVNFENHQVGLRKEREGKSDIPAPDELRNWYGETPAKVGLRLSRIDNDKVNDKVNDKYSEPPEPSPMFRLLSDEFVRVTGIPEFTGNAQVWVESIKELEKMGTLPEDVPVAVNINIENNYAVQSPKSILKTARTAIARRVSGGPAVKVEAESNEDRIRKAFGYDK